VKQRQKYCETAMKKYYETVPKKLCTSNEKISWNSANNNNNNTVKVDFIPPIRDYELGLCVLWGGGAVYTVSLNDL
jgi:hypothetical protein